jgi:hypothetical protein
MVVINLKRFEFDYNTMTRFKVNDYCEFPERINFKKWTKEGIEANEDIDDVSDEPAEMEPKVIHSGGSRQSKLRKSTEFTNSNNIDAAETTDPLNLSVELKNDSLDVEDQALGMKKVGP